MIFCQFQRTVFTVKKERNGIVIICFIRAVKKVTEGKRIVRRNSVTSVCSAAVCSDTESRSAAYTVPVIVSQQPEPRGTAVTSGKLNDAEDIGCVAVVDGQLH